MLAEVLAEGLTVAELVRTAPHGQMVAQLDGSGLDDPARWSTTWRAHLRRTATRG